MGLQSYWKLNKRANFFKKKCILWNKRVKKELLLAALLVESSIQFSNTFIEDLLKVYEFAEKNSPYL